MNFLELSFWSVIPPLLTIFLVLKTRKILLSMAVGITLGCFILGKFNPINALKHFDSIFIGTYNEDGTLTPGSITTPDNLMVLLSMVIIGALIGLLVKSGGSHAFAEYMARRINSKKRAGLMTCLLGTLLMIDDYFDNLTTGATMRAISDKNSVPREKLSYYIDSTVCGINSISPISSWSAFLAGLLATGMATAGLEGNSYQLLLRSIPYNFFIFVCLVMVYCVAAFNLNIGPMARAEKRAATTGKLLEHSFSGDSDEEASYDELEPAKGKPVDLIFPITLLICLVLFFMLYTGGFFTHYDLMQTVSQMEGIRSLMYGLVFTIIITAIYLRIRNTAPFTELASAAFVGIKSILYANLVLILGWTLGGVSESLGITQFLISVFQGNIPPVFTPAILFLLCAATAFAIGGGWTTFAIMIPVVVPFAVATDADMLLCISAIIGGAGMGATCSPLADTSIVSATSGELSIIDHIKTQAPYSIICGVIALAGYLVAGFTETLVFGYIVVAPLFIISVAIMKKISLREAVLPFSTDTERSNQQLSVE
ncbi:Na+/H+ antiporter NhaC family protein [Gallibacter sp. Marseille-QA0791]|uniref:Na+/H+ antiporter NhaC family protein n=1 Tax=Gallibacter sp. Marseille-QA0791 TaxID=3378781 RepID=UPI003D14C843